jgi:uncharacterized delta-60 repeat protein
MLILALTLLTYFIPRGVEAADGDLDAGFGTGGPTVPAGVSRTSFGANHSDIVNAIGIQSVGINAGKIIAAGVAQATGSNQDFAMARYTMSGGLDTTFGPGATGLVTTNFTTGSTDRIFDVAIGSGDKIVAVGRTETTASASCSLGNGDFGIAVYDANGNLDTTFNSCGAAPCGGKKEIDFFGCPDNASAVVIQSDGKIVIAGEVIQFNASTMLFDSFLALVRLNADGTFDNTFGPGMDGKLLLNEVTSGTGTPNDIALISSGPQAGKFIVVGRSTANDFFVARITANGSGLDSGAGGFGPSDTGVVTTDFSNTDFANSVTLQPADGKIIAAGVKNSFGGPSQDFAMTRYDSDGNLDGGFGTGGKVTEDFSGGGVNRLDEAKFVGVAPNGKIIMSGNAQGDDGVNQIAIARYDSGGVLDPAFGMSGKVLTHLGQNMTTMTDNGVTANAGALQADGKVLVGGTISTVGQPGNDFFVARFLNTSVTGPALSSAGAMIGTEGCAPGNGAIDPGETVTVSFCVQNTGTADTTSALTGTLQASGGVTSPSGPQSYGVVMAGGPSVCRNFTFTASGTCGGTITASIQFQDGKANLGTVTYTFTLGVSGMCCTPPPCMITCPPNQTRSNDPNQCGAVVNYPAPTSSGTCGTITCSPSSGSFFPVGTTTVTCSNTGGSPSCTFTVTVNDTQPPSITCPGSVTAVADQTTCQAGTPSCVKVNFPAPVATDNCPGVTAVCTPPSGSCFPLGNTTVTCTATDASGNTATCTFTVTAFDVCLQDNSSPSTVLLWNSVSGAYRFCCKGVVYTGVGKLGRQGCIFTLDHTTLDRRVRGTADKSAHAGNASIQSPAGTTRCTITDSDIRNNACSCQ